MDEAQIVDGVALIAHRQAAEIAQPGEEAFDLPAAAIAAQRPSILRLGPDPSTPMRRNHLDAKPRQNPIKAVRIVGAIANQASWQLVEEAESRVGAPMVTS